MRRLFSLAVGLGAGVMLGASIVRRFDGAARVVGAGPSDVTARVRSQVRGLREETRRLAAAREAELRERYAVPDLPRRPPRTG
ncbi:MAG: hypothetical protein WD011_05465 [Nitriliruptoraceae bacterium]